MIKITMIKRRLHSCCRYLAFTFLSILSTSGFTQEKQPPRISGVNNIEFQQQEYNKAFAGNGFLIEHNDKVYAVTVKHVLFEAKTPDMKHVWLADNLKQWRIHPNKDANNYIQLGNLINANKNEEIDGDILQKDWLLFEVEENNSSLTPLTIRRSSLETGEKLRAIGCSYVNKDTCDQDTYTGTFKSYAEHNLRIDLGDTPIARLRGLSGSPVVDEHNHLVGIVSNVLPAEGATGLDFAPAKLDYLFSILPG
jgi:S1-C subfamily serine protease